MAEGLRLRALRIKHGDRPLLELDLTVPPATILSVMGPSGVGKSTLLAAITGQMSADFSLEGEILLNGRDLCPLPPQARRVGPVGDETSTDTRCGGGCCGRWGSCRHQRLSRVRWFTDRPRLRAGAFRCGR